MYSPAPKEIITEKFITTVSYGIRHCCYGSFRLTCDSETTVIPRVRCSPGVRYYVCPVDYRELLYGAREVHKGLNCISCPHKVLSTAPAVYNPLCTIGCSPGYLEALTPTYVMFRNKKEILGIHELRSLLSLYLHTSR